jgi:hypothetical protein
MEQHSLPYGEFCEILYWGVGGGKERLLKNLPRKFKSVWNRTKLGCTLREWPRNFMTPYWTFSVNEKNLHINTVEKLRTHILCQTLFFLLKSCCLQSNYQKTDPRWNCRSYKMWRKLIRTTWRAIQEKIQACSYLKSAFFDWVKLRGYGFCIADNYGENIHSQCSIYLLFCIWL